ncbi:hypothetical protein [Ahniella affigens]|uniref:hypothetical protein n=1 Tax=Ahniella affigens TaxID=2021234 RepID=UPI0011B28C62|nr:hypothetical protein [Ahniella affigens]
MMIWIGFAEVQAATLRVESVTAPGLRVQDLRVQTDPANWTWTVAAAESDDLALTVKSLRWQCQWQQTRCHGPIQASAFARGQLGLDWQARSAELKWPGGRLSLDAHDAADWRVQADNLSLARLQTRVQRAWAELSSLSGGMTLDAHLKPDRVDATWQATGLNFDQRDGTIAGASLMAAGDLTYGLNDSVLRVQSRFDSGEVLIGPLYRQIDQPVALSVVADLSKQMVSVPELAVTEGNHLSLQAALSLTPAGDIASVKLDRLQLHWPAAQSWTAPVLANAGFEGLELAGQAEISGLWQPGGWRQGEAHVRDLAVSDPEQRLQASGLQLDANLSDAPTVSRLSWQDLALFKIPFSAGSFAWLWQPDSLRQQGTLQVETLGGSLSLNALSRQSGRWQGSVRASGLDFGALSQHFGWPAFGGKISADIQDFTFSDGQLKIPNDIEIEAFSGRIGVQHLVTERLFGDAPALSADIRMKGLDLKAVTAAMSFGQIEGTLDGYINGLRLLNWTPLGFDARFQSQRREGQKQKISRRAVEGLSNIGGASLNNALINLVDSFSYADLGIACRLKEDVCQMDGIDSDGSGYTIVKGSGLPRLTVRGYQRQVNWPVMLRRLQAAASGTGPIIE